MAYAIHRHPHKHISIHDEPRRQTDGGWWKFGLAAAIMTAVAVVVLTSPVLQRSESPKTSSDTGVTPSVVFMAPVITDLSPRIVEAVQPSVQAPAPAIASTVDAVQANIAPVAAETTQSSRITSAAAQSAAAAAPQRAASVHDIDFLSMPSLQALASQVGGRIDATAAKYGDLTGDGSDEAIVPITSDGTAGMLAYMVVTQRNGSPTAILTRPATRDRRGLVTSFDNGQLTESSAYYGPSDANCCPSQLIRTYFRWDGAKLLVDHSTTIAIPTGKQAD